jgi:hypothetical protein
MTRPIINRTRHGRSGHFIPGAEQEQGSVRFAIKINGATPCAGNAAQSAEAYLDREMVINNPYPGTVMMFRARIRSLVPNPSANFR